VDSFDLLFIEYIVGRKMCDLFVCFFNYHNSIKETADLILTLNKIGKQMYTSF